MVKQTKFWIPLKKYRGNGFWLNHGGSLVNTRLRLGIPLTVGTKKRVRRRIRLFKRTMKELREEAENVYTMNLPQHLLYGEFGFEALGV